MGSDHDVPGEKLGLQKGNQEDSVLGPRGLQQSGACAEIKCLVMPEGSKGFQGCGQGLKCIKPEQSTGQMGSEMPLACWETQPVLLPLASSTDPSFLACNITLVCSCGHFFN